MPKIKNRKKLVRRATDHYKADHIKRDKGYLQVNGGFQGCAIGCLVSPVTHTGVKRDPYLKRFWDKANDKFGGFYYNDETDEEDQDIICKIMKKEFGLAPSLTLLAEQVFEDRDYVTDEEAYTWPMDFAKALPPEGTNITDKQVQKFVIENGGLVDAPWDYQKYSRIVFLVPDSRQKVLDWLGEISEKTKKKNKKKEK